MIHKLKILPLYFEAVALREKTFEIRVNDRDYHVGDTLLLKEWENDDYTGREISRYVNYIYYGDGTFGIPEGVVIMNLKLSGAKATADTPQTESTGSPIGDYRDGAGAWVPMPLGDPGSISDGTLLTALETWLSRNPDKQIKVDKRITRHGPVFTASIEPAPWTLQKEET